MSRFLRLPLHQVQSGALEELGNASLGVGMDPTSSMQYTIGTALSRAQDFGHTVEVLVDGQWVAGLVVANDGVGVVLDNDGREHCVVRLESVSAVKVSAAAPVRRPARNGMHVDRTLDGAVVMPSPRATTE